MGSINKIFLQGNLGKDPEIKTLDNGNKVCSASLATSETWKDKDGNKQSRTEWHNLRCWGVRGENFAKLLKKGKEVIIIGRVQYQEYEKDGVKKYATTIRVDEFSLTSGSGNNSGGGPGPGPEPHYTPSSDSSDHGLDGSFDSSTGGSSSLDDDIPF